MAMATTAPMTPALRKYHEAVIASRFTRYMDFPRHVHLETMTVCNANCCFCPYSSLERKGQRMSDELLAKIINDLTDIPPDLTFQLSPFKVNEPFLDTRLFDLLQTINDRLPNARITLTSNATPITSRNLERLALVRNMGYLWISFNDHRPQHYEATMQLPYERTLARLTMIHEQKQAGTIPFRVVLSRVGDESDVDQEFRAWVAERFPLFESSIFRRGAWLGQVDTPVADVPNVGCARWFDLSITATGIVAHCCMDGNARYPIGDVKTQHVLEVYNLPEYRALRESANTRLNASPCRTCTFL